MRKKALNVALVLAFLFSVVDGTELVKIAEANPWLIFEPVDPIPGTIPPVITISSPKNNTVYSRTAVNLTLHITKPQPPCQLESGISYARYTLGGNITGIYFCDHYSSGSPPGIPELDYSQIISALPDGYYELVIEAAGIVLPGNLTIFTMYTNSTVFFTTGNPSSSPSSSASPAPSPEATLTPEPQPEPFPTILVLAAGLSVAVGGIGFLVYCKKRNKGQPPKV